MREEKEGVRIILMGGTKEVLNAGIDKIQVEGENREQCVEESQ